MKPFINILLVLFLFSPCLTGLSCSTGQNRNDGSSKKFDDQSDELSKIVYKAKEIPIKNQTFFYGQRYILLGENCWKYSVGS
jgi:hypothetical protein